MATRPRARNTDELDAAMLAACLGDPCPEGFNPYTYLVYEETVTTGKGYPPEHAAALLAAWPQLRPAVLAQWRLRKRTGNPPGCALDGKARP